MIKKLNEEYSEEIINLHKKAMFPIWDKLGRKYSMKEVQNFIKAVFDNGKVFGYFIENKIVGAIGLEFRKNSGEIDLILVLPEFQGKNIGKELMRYVEDKFNSKINRLILQVLIKSKAVDFYKKIGYRIINKRDKKYIMEKIIK